MHDYVEGKVEWMAYGLPVEGTRGPYVGEFLRPVKTCPPDDLHGPAVVVTAGGVAIGTVDEGSSTMDPVPDTIRPSVPLSDLDERAANQLVTTPDGVLLGAVDPESDIRSDWDDWTQFILTMSPAMRSFARDWSARWSFAARWPAARMRVGPSGSSMPSPMGCRG